MAILSRLWISEGIPFAFRNCPGLYEEFRNSLSEQLELDAKQISIAGSGRLGYSLAPSTWGVDYRPSESDLDLFAVSEELFKRLCKDFERWRADYDRGEIEPKTKKERVYWGNNRKEVPSLIERGFIDSVRVPNWPNYGVFLKVNRHLEHLRVKLQMVEAAPKPPRPLTLRCYRDWSAYERQMVISLKCAVAERA